jgi:hypothetical protein
MLLTLILILILIVLAASPDRCNPVQEQRFSAA